MKDVDQILVFDRLSVRKHRDRAARNFGTHSALFTESADLLLERLNDIRQEFRTVLDLGAHTGQLAKHFSAQGEAPAVAADISEKMLATGLGSFHRVVADEECLPFAPESFDLVISNLSLHWVNDLPGALLQIKNILRPGGLFLAAFIGGNSLPELRNCLLDAEIAVSGGASPRFSPTITMASASALLQRAGFSLPVTDMEKITFVYPDAFALMHELRGMGETNAGQHRLRHFTRRAIFMEMAKLYDERFAATGGGVTAEFELLFVHGVRS